MRDKLIELIKHGLLCPDMNTPFDGACDACQYAETMDCDHVRLADYLIANGVTIADVPATNVGKWIPVSERLPEKNCKCLVCVDVDVWGKEYKAIAVEQYSEDWLGWYSDGGKIPNITHWMPMPLPPKEGE